MSTNELDDLLRQKEAEFDIPFKEEYWKRAEALLDQKRRTRFAFWNARNIGLVALMVMLSGMAGWYVIANQQSANTSNETSHQVVSPSAKAGPYFESNDDNGVST